MLRCQIRFCEPQGRCCHGPCTAAPALRISAGGLPVFLVPGKYVEMPWHCHPTIPSRPRAQHKIPLTKPWTDPMLNITKPGFLMDSLQHPKMKPATRPSLPCVWRSRVGSIEASKSSMRFRKSPSSCCEIGRAVTSWGLEGWLKKPYESHTSWGPWWGNVGKLWLKRFVVAAPTWQVTLTTSENEGSPCTSIGPRTGSTPCSESTRDGGGTQILKEK